MIIRTLKPKVPGPLLAAVALASAGLIGSPIDARAQQMFHAPRDFMINQACQATRKLNSGDPVDLEIGVSIKARGTNKRRRPTHISTKIGTANKWVKLSCGQFVDGNHAGFGLKCSTADGYTQTGLCLPFFDEADNPVTLPDGSTADVTPPPPTLNDFDKAVMAVCGEAGKVVPRDEFKALFISNPEVLTRVRMFTQGKVFASKPAHTENASYLEDLTSAWFERTGFDHIFCGEPKGQSQSNGIGGLHFHGRYLQLQQRGDACRIPPAYGRNEVVPNVIYSMGVAMKNKSGDFVTSDIKGYGHTMAAEDLFKVVTRAFSENPTESAEKSSGCILRVTDDVKTFDTVFVRRAGGITTFYPDATPNDACGRFKNDPCAKEINVQAP